MATSKRRGLVLIGYFKLLKAVLLFGAAFELFSLLRHDMVTTLTGWAMALHIDPDGQLIHHALAKLLGVKRSTLQALGIGTLLYASIFTTEGVGLLLAKTWAEYLTLGVTISFLPIEIYELCVHASVLRALTILVNLVVAIYLGLSVRTRMVASRA
jgi:uncharacterized membrane protein (DUF2068 family)